MGQRLGQLINEHRADYDAAKSNQYRRRRTVPSAGASADYHYRSESDYLKLIEYARDFDRNDTVSSVVDRAVENTIQQGFTLAPNTGDDVLDRDLMARWNEWADDADECHEGGEFSFFELEELMFRQQLVDGDIFALPLRSGALSLIEAHRCRTPRNTKKPVVHGVLLGDHRRHLEYWFTNEDLDPNRALSKVSDVTPVAARDEDGQRRVFHIYHPKRTSQTRGITSFAPVFNHIAMREDIEFAKLVQQQVVSCFAIFRKRDANYEGGLGSPTGQQTTRTLVDNSSQTVHGISPGLQIEGNPGEELQGFSPNVPNETFFEHMKWVVTQISNAFGLPLILVLLDGSQTNFSGWRGAMDQAKNRFKSNQKHLVARFHKPVYQWKVEQWLFEDAALRSASQRSEIRIFEHKWNPPRWPYIEPLKDATANSLRVATTQISRRRLAAENGYDWDEITTEQIDDHAMAIEKAIVKARDMQQRLSLEDDERVHWRELLSLPLPQGMSVTIGQSPSTDNGQSGQGEDDDEAA